MSLDMQGNGGGAWPTGEVDKEEEGPPVRLGGAVTHVFHSEGLLLQPLHSQDVLDGDVTEWLVTYGKEGVRTALGRIAHPKREAPHGPVATKLQQRVLDQPSFPEGWENRKTVDMGLG